MMYSISRESRVYDNDSGDYVAVSDDKDGLGLVELVQSDSGKEIARISMTHEQASLFAVEINHWLESLPHESS